MSLRQEEVIVRGRTYTVRELSVLEILPIMTAHGNDGAEDDSDDPSSRSILSLAIFQASCTDDAGEPMDPELTGAGVYMRLIPVAMRLNALSDAEDGSGNG